MVELLNELNKCVNLQSPKCEFSNNECYNPGKPALIFVDTLKCSTFRNLKKKIIFISESPYNFPNATARTIPQFIINHLQKNLKSAYNIYGLHPSYLQYIVPSNIFEFIYLTFLPIFRNVEPSKWAYEFLNRIYWTHYGKRTPKKNNKKIDKSGFENCFPLLKKEIKGINPDLIICATSKALKELSGEEYKKLEKRQEEAWRENKNFISFKICGENRKIAIFPNPSPINEDKAHFYQKDYVSNLIKRIHSYIIHNYI